jgi:hypothetical protein
MTRFRFLPAATAAFVLGAAMITPLRGQQTSDGVEYSPTLAGYNVALANNGISNVRIDRADLLVTPDGWNGVTTLIANDRTHQEDSLFVAGDPRRGGSAAISYIFDESHGAALAFANPTGNAVVTLPSTVTGARVDASMARWETEPSCPAPTVVKVPYTGVDPDLIDGLILGPPFGVGTPQADITQGGWLPATFFDALEPNGSASILGVTFIFVDGSGNPTDIDNNGRADVAFREIYFNRRFAWSEGPSRPRGIDIDSVATHESGHAFGLDHFGKVFLDNNGVIKFAPRAVMNAVYVSPFADLAGTDNASFCSIWASKH